MKLSIVIPIYNSESTLIELTDRLIKTFEDLIPGYDYEIILVDDCSNDNSWTLMKKIHNENNRIKVIHLLKNFGQHNATLSGLHYAEGDYIVIMDDDLQHPPEEIPKLISKIQEGYSVVYGRYEIKKHSRLENFFSKRFQNFIHSILDIPASLSVTSFAIFSSDVVKNMISIRSSYIFLPALVSKSVPVNKITNIIVDHHPRKVGSSNYHFRKYMALFLNLIINYSNIPLFIVGIIGIVSSVLSICYGLYILGHFMMDPTYGLMGWNSLIVAITLLGGLTLLSIAVIGEYLRRILTEVSYGQQYVIGEMYV
ncbi:glycosyltransferase family 2 protein [Methanolacinia paynteri]|uniref:glycosyltransferase family 2 protein n=1 Tax=Methanolacinia paynteri TaxID=230356 RepID=UPI00064FDA0E|nr:glycosyltransferase family 2 protein [Methanolacinia paynteri]